MEVLPSFRKVLTAAADLLDLELSWIEPPSELAGKSIDAVGSGPSDETVTVTELYIRPGQTVKRGQAVAALEASKSVFELTSPHEGVIESLLIVEGDVVSVGAPIARLTADGSQGRPKPLTTEPAYRAVLSRPMTTISRPTQSLDGGNRVDSPHFTTGRAAQRAEAEDRADAAQTDTRDLLPPLPKSEQAPSASANGRSRSTPSKNGIGRRTRVGIAGISSVLGSRKLSNADLLAIAPPELRSHFDADGIVRKTGIRSRYWAGEGETAVSMATKAARSALEQAKLRPEDLDLILCATTTPNMVTPSLACQILGGLGSQAGEGPPVQAFDINAACSGYLYALQIARDRLAAAPDARVLLVTAEVLSPLLDLADADTAIIFGDAATATLFVGESNFDAEARFRVLSSDLSAKNDHAAGVDGAAAGRGLRDHAGPHRVFGGRARDDGIAAPGLRRGTGCRR